MKVFGCRNQYSSGGGLILVAANTKEEAYLTAAMDEKISYMFVWVGDDYMRCEPDGNINHCKSVEYPLEKWFESKHLSIDLTEPKVISENHYSE
jgi:hypothetical protein